jgi:hypothetical protein
MAVGGLSCINSESFRNAAPFGRGHHRMQHLCIALPVQPGKTQVLKEFVKSIKESRWKEYEDFQNRSRVQKVVWFLQSSPHGDQFLIYNGGEDFTRLSREFGASTHPFDLWFGQQLQEITGIDVSTFGPSWLPEELLTYGF